MRSGSLLARDCGGGIHGRTDPVGVIIAVGTGRSFERHCERRRGLRTNRRGHTKPSLRGSLPRTRGNHDVRWSCPGTGYPTPVQLESRSIPWSKWVDRRRRGMKINRAEYSRTHRTATQRLTSGTPDVWMTLDQSIGVTRDHPLLFFVQIPADKRPNIRVNMVRRRSSVSFATLAHSSLYSGRYCYKVLIIQSSPRSLGPSPNSRPRTISDPDQVQ